MVPGAQFARYRPEDAGANRLHLRVDQHRGVAVEADHRAVRALDVLADPHHHGLHDLNLLDAAARDRLLHRDDDDVADGGVLALGAAQHLDAHDAARAGIVRHVEVGLHLNHWAPRTSLLRVSRLARFGRWRAVSLRAALLRGSLLGLDRDRRFGPRPLLAPGHGPALKLGDRLVLLDPDQVANRILVLLI